MTKKKKQKNGGAAEAPSLVVSVAAHPRARASVRRTRARTGLAAFVIVGLLCLKAGVPGQEAALRALIAGIVGNLIGWACAVAVWRSLVMAELKLARDAYNQRVRAANDAATTAETQPATQAA
jgi:hypothetical protein